MNRAADSEGWTGWAYGADGRAVTVTSDRLGTADVVNRWFPKIRAWFALGAPLELLSPLSIARVIGLIALATWPLGVLSGHPALVGLFLIAVSAATLVWLLKARSLGPDDSRFVLLLHLGLVIVSIGSASGQYRVLLVSVVVAAMAVFAGLFVPPKALLATLAVGAVPVLVVARFAHAGLSFGDAAVLTLFATLLAVMTALTARTSRLAGSLDPETGVSNNRGLVNHLRKLLVRSDVAVATVHLSGASEIRDALGHEVSAELIKRAVEDLGQVLPATARVGRGADDDVVVLVPNEPERAMPMDAHVAAILRRIDIAIGTGRYLAGDIEVNLNAHVGVAIADLGEAIAEAEIASDVIRRSALAARSARDSGRQVAYWDGTTAALRTEDLEILAQLRNAAERGELWLAYQPQVRPSDSRIMSVEALLRWTSPVHGIVPPGRFIPLAERTGLIERLTDWVLIDALDAQVRWRRLGIDISVSVNVSPLSLRSVDFAERVGRVIDERRLPASALMLEVTESMAFDIPDAVERLAPLHSRGVRISIDDFGTGYTSLSVLPRLPLDELKVDQQFVRESLTSKASEAIVVSICDLAHRLGLSAVAEGVEDAELAELMSSFGFDLLQGYHFDRPMPEDELIARLGVDTTTVDGTAPVPDEPETRQVESIPNGSTPDRARPDAVEERPLSVPI